MCIRDRDLNEAFKALGFDPAALGQEADGKQTKPKARARTRGELAADGLGAKATGDPSPRAHGSRQETKNIYIYCVELSLFEFYALCHCHASHALQPMGLQVYD